MSECRFSLPLRMLQTGESFDFSQVLTAALGPIWISKVLQDDTEGQNKN